MFEDTKLGRVFFYIHGLVHIRVHTTVNARNLEIQNLSLGTKRVRLRLIVTIPTMVRSSQGAIERLRSDSLGRVSGRLP